MSDNRHYTAAVLLSAAAFVVLGFLLDRDLFSSPLRLTKGGVARERAAVLDSIGRYNAILTDIYATGGMPALLDDFPATKAIRHGLFRDVGFLRDSGRIIVYDLAGAYPVQIAFPSPFSAEAVLFEEWNYAYQKSGDRQPISRVRGMGQGFRYRLSWKDSAWIVTGWDPVPVEYQQGRAGSGAR